MSLGPFNAVQQTHPTLPAYKLGQLGLFWLSFFSGLVLLAFLLMRPQASTVSELSPQRPHGSSNRGVLFDINLGDTPTPPPVIDTPAPTVTPGEGITPEPTTPTDTPEPIKPSATPIEPTQTPNPTRTPIPTEVTTPIPTNTKVPLSTQIPTVTSPPPATATATTAPPSDTPVPAPTKPSATPITPDPTATKPPPASVTPVPITATPKPNPTTKPNPTAKPVDPTKPPAQPTATNTLVPTLIAPSATATPRRRPTNTPTVTVQPSPTTNPTATPQVKIDATATTVAEPVVVPTAVPEATTTPEPIPTSALPKFIADNPTGPILIYTYTQQLKADGNHLVAACVLNIGDAPASNVETEFAAKSPAVITGLRIPSELSSREAKRATVRISTLSPKFMKQLEVSVGSVDIPVPEWISVTITRAYALNHPGDPAFPVKCEPEGVDAVTSDVKEVTLSVGPYREILAQAQKINQDNRNVIVMGNGELGPAISLSVLQCVVGWIAFCLATLLLLVFVRRRRRQQMQTINP